MARPSVSQVRPLRDRARRFGMALGHAHDDDRPLLQVARAVGGADHHRGAAVALQRAVEQAQRIGDHARGLVILDGDRIAHRRVAVEDRVLARRHRDLGELARRRAVEFHVPARPRRRAAPARSCRTASRTRRQRELRHLLQRASIRRAGVAGAAERQQHVVADAGATAIARTGSRRRARAAHRREQRQRRSGMPKLVMKSSATPPPWTYGTTPSMSVGFRPASSIAFRLASSCSASPLLVVPRV